MPVGVTTSLSEADNKRLMAECDALCGQLKAAGVRMKGDTRDNYSPGWKFNHWELKVGAVDAQINMRCMLKLAIIYQIS